MVGLDYCPECALPWDECECDTYGEVDDYPDSDEDFEDDEEDENETSYTTIHLKRCYCIQC